MRVLLQQQYVLVEGVVDILRADILASDLVLHAVELRGVVEPLNHVFLDHFEEQLFEIVALELDLDLVLELEGLADALHDALYDVDDGLVLLDPEDSQLDHVVQAHQAGLDIEAVEPIVVLLNGIHDVLEQPLGIVLEGLLIQVVLLLHDAEDILYARVAQPVRVHLLELVVVDLLHVPSLLDPLA